MTLSAKAVGAMIADLTHVMTALDQSAFAGDADILNGQPTARMKPDGLRSMASTLRKHVEVLVNGLEGVVVIEEST